MIISGRREEGQELAEYALVLPVLLLLLFGIIEIGSLIYSYNTIANAAREGSRYGVTHPGDYEGVEAATRRLTVGLDQAALTVNPIMNERTVCVEVTYSFGLTTGMIVQALGRGPTLQLRAVSTMRSE